MASRFSQADSNGPRVEIKRNRYGYSIRVWDKDPANQFLPPDPAEVERAMERAKVGVPREK